MTYKRKKQQSTTNSKGKNHVGYVQNQSNLQEMYS